MNNLLVLHTQYNFLLPIRFTTISKIITSNVETGVDSEASIASFQRLIKCGWEKHGKFDHSLA